MLRASIRREKRSCLKRLYSFSPLPSTISQKAWRSEWPLELWPAIQVQKPLSGRLVWPLGLACKISQKGLPFRFRFGQMENPVSMPFIGDLCPPSLSPARCSSGLVHDGHLALRPFFCSRCDDLCGGRRVDPRLTN